MLDERLEVVGAVTVVTCVCLFIDYHSNHRIRISRTMYIKEGVRNIEYLSI